MAAACRPQQPGQGQEAPHPLHGQGLLLGQAEPCSAKCGACRVTGSKSKASRSQSQHSDAEPTVGSYVADLISGWTACPMLLKFAGSVLGHLKQRPQPVADLATATNLSQDSLSIILGVCDRLGYVCLNRMDGWCSLVAGADLDELEQVAGASPKYLRDLKDLYVQALGLLPNHSHSQCKDSSKSSAAASGPCATWYTHHNLRDSLKSRRLQEAVDGAVLMPLLTSLALSADWEGGCPPSSLNLSGWDEQDLNVLGALLEERLFLGTVEADDMFQLAPKGQETLAAVRTHFQTIAVSSRLLASFVCEWEGEALPTLSEGQAQQMEAMRAIGQSLQDEADAAALASLLESEFAHVRGGHDLPPPRYVSVEVKKAELARRVHEGIGNGDPRTRDAVTLVALGLGLGGADDEERSKRRDELRQMGVPHVAPPCELREPATLLPALRELGVDTSTVLHVHSKVGCFLTAGVEGLGDQATAARAFAETQLAGLVVSLDEHHRRISPVDVLSSLVGHFQSWAEALGDSDSPHGLLLHDRVPMPMITSSETAAVRCLAGQPAVPPLLTALAAGMAGLLPARARSLQQQDDPATHSTVVGQRLVPKNFQVRLAELGDLGQLVRLEEISWAPEHRASREVLLKRLETSPATNWVCVRENRVVAVLYAQRVADVASVDSQTIFTASQSHVPGGRVLQLLAIAAEKSSDGIGSELRAFALHLARLDHSVETVVAVTLARGFKRQEQSGMVGSMQQYVDRHARGELFDPIIGFHTSHGAQVRRLVHGFRPADMDNHGIGVLIEYDLVALQGVGSRPKPREETTTEERCEYKSTPTPLGARAAVVAPAPAAAAATVTPTPAPQCPEDPLTALIAAEISKLGFTVGEKDAAVGFLSIGLDSVELTALKVAIASKLELHLPATVLFDYPSIQDLSQYLRSLLNSSQSEAESCGPAPQQGPPHTGRTQSPMVETVRAALQELGFDISDERLETGLLSNGLDSVDIGALCSALGARLGLSVPATLVFDHPSVKLLAQALEALQPAESMVDEEPQGRAAPGSAKRSEAAPPEEELALEAASRAAVLHLNFKSGSDLLGEICTVFDTLLRCSEGTSKGDAEGLFNRVGDVEAVLRALLNHFLGVEVQARLRKRWQACGQDRHRYVYGIEDIVSKGHVQVFRKIGLSKPSAPGSWSVVQGMLTKAVLRFWSQGQVRALALQLRQATGEDAPAQAPPVSGMMATKRSVNPTMAR